ncbi:hypothetical protein SAMN05428979_3979 [Stappia sp. ES.058]|nr:hypothetical protein SAMN05428979_3979 [Stappia sp. ES.058]
MARFVTRTGRATARAAGCMPFLAVALALTQGPEALADDLASPAPSGAPRDQALQITPYL